MANAGQVADLPTAVAAAPACRGGRHRGADERVVHEGEQARAGCHDLKLKRKVDAVA